MKYLRLNFVFISTFAAVFAAGAADMITAREATNIAESVALSSGVGAARMLPKYLHYVEFDECYEEDAHAFYERMGGMRDEGRGMRGGCSVLRRGNVVGRNFDWPLDEAAEFVVRVSPLGSRHGSVGIATLGTNLTERMVTSGQHTDLYRILPGKTVDGINDAGLVAEVNVIPYDPASSPTQSVTRTLHAFGVVRYALDNFGSAREAAEYVAEHYYIPEGSEYAYHWSFSDAEGSWIVEDGKCAKATQGQVMSMSMTNFRIWWISRFIDPETGTIDRAALAAEDPYGTGVERFEAVYGTEDVAEALETVAYTKTYLAATEPRRISEFAAEGVARVDEDAALSNIAAQVIAAWPGREAAREQGVWWQTVHSSIYDIEKRTLAVAVQEDFSKRYVFHADETNERFRKVRAKVLAEVARASGVEERIIEEINAFKAFDIRVMDELPEEGVVGVVYLVKADDYATTKTRDEYLWSQGAWRLVGSTRFDSDMIAKTHSETPIPPNLTNRVSYIHMQTHDGVTREEDESGAVEIGKGAKATVDSGYIESLTNTEGRLELRSVSVAIGKNAKATGGIGGSTQAISIGYNSKASAVNGISIGSGSVHWWEDDETGPATIASGAQSIAAGYNAKAKAELSVQIGSGKNETPRSLKFLDTFVVRDGKVQAMTDTNEIERISRSMFEPEVVRGIVDDITAKSHAMTTYVPTGVVEELTVGATGTRNLELYLPNVPELRMSLPVVFDVDETAIPGAVKLGRFYEKALRLPVMISLKEPVSGTLILDFEELDDDYEWVTYATSAVEESGIVTVSGENLQFAKSAEIDGEPEVLLNAVYASAKVAAEGAVGKTVRLLDADGRELVSVVVANRNGGEM